MRNISPALLYTIKRYFVDLIDICKEKALPSFLVSAPDYIKFHIMSDLYLHHLTTCFVFEGVDRSFLIQLTTRLERYIYFPGNYITEQGDVDQNMYFVQEGEVYCLEKDANFPALERPVNVYSKDEFFGILQGIFPYYPHTYTHRARILTVILTLNFHHWDDMRKANPDIAEMIYTKVSQKGSYANDIYNNYASQNV